MSGPDNSHIPQNQRRKSRFELRGQRHLWAIVLGALTSAVLVHLTGYVVLRVTGVGMTLSPVEGQLPSDAGEEVLRPVVLQSDENEKDEVPPELPQADADNLPPEDIQMPDPVDMELESVTIAPGETAIGLESIDAKESQALTSQLDQLADEVGSAGREEPGMSEALAITSNPLKVINTTGLHDVDPDEWNKENLKGNKGVGDDRLPSGTKSLKDLLAQPSNTLGRASGHGLIGADLLFEYDKAVMKNSARIGLLQLAALICKNPQTSFIIEGHTDSFGSREYNKLLSLMRANAVRQWLQANGIDMSHVYIRACGNDRPVVGITGDRKAQAANRRVEIHMRKKGETMPEDALPISYKVDMTTPIARQLAAKKADVVVDPPAGDVPSPRPAAVPVPAPRPVAPPVAGSVVRQPVQGGNVQPSPAPVADVRQGNGNQPSSGAVRPVPVSPAEGQQKQPPVPEDDTDLEDLPARVVKPEDIPVAEPLPGGSGAGSIPVAEPLPEHDAPVKKENNQFREPAFRDPLLP